MKSYDPGNGRRGHAIPNLALTLICSAAAVYCCCCPVLFGDESQSFDTLSAQYIENVRPLLDHFCVECHSSEKNEGELDLQRLVTMRDVRREAGAWLKIAEMLAAGEMPPEESPQLSPEQRKELVGWTEQYLHAEALASAGDPGPVVLRRLTNAEYTFTICDLTGVSLNPAHEFPADGAAGEGFTNTGNALVMSPGLLQKYLAAGREVAAHAVLLSDGFRFSPHTTRRDWTNAAVAKIREFYEQRVDVVDLGIGTSVGVLNLHGNCRIGKAGKLPLEKYFAATLLERPELRSGAKTIEAVAEAHRLNARYLGLLWAELNSSQPSLLLDEIRGRWREARPEDAASLANDVAQWQKGLWTFYPIGLMGRKGSRPQWQKPVNPLVPHQEFRYPIPAIDEVQEVQETVVSLVATDCGDGNEQDYVVWDRPRLSAENQPDIFLCDIDELRGIESGRFGKHPNGTEIDSASLCVQAPSVITLRLPARIAAGRTLVTTASLDSNSAGDASVQTDIIADAAEAKPGLIPAATTVTLSLVTALYPDHHTVAYRNPILVGDDSPRREQFESAMDAHRRLFPTSLCYPQIVPADEVLTLTQFHREDEHLVRLLLDEPEKQELDRLWEELRFVSQDPLKLAAVLDSLVETTQGHPQQGAFDEAVEPFHRRADEFRKRLVDTEPKHLDALVAFTARAWRRPVTGGEEEELRGLYHRLRELELPHEEAFRLALARVFVASPFLYRLEEAPEGNEPLPVSDWELANRLSYFLWSSMPDEKLRGAAGEGHLTRDSSDKRRHADDDRNLAEDQGQDNELLRQSRRMLRDPRVRRLATEFACQWIHIHEFDPLEQKSDRHFPEFVELRDDMYEESILFFTDLFQNDRSLLSLLDADYTFVNEQLAKFYGIPFNSQLQGGNTEPSPQGRPENTSGEVLDEGWRRVDGIRQHGRGGILGLAATLAKQSGATRTSPILRGNWVSEVLLGEKLPRPPPNVPPLADAVPEGLTERQLIERHSSDAACAKCHARIDPFGFALEDFDAIGRRRNTNSGRPATDARATLPDGTQIDGLDGLRDYLVVNRRDTFIRQFCRKLLGYALGRQLQLSDEPLLDRVMSRLAKDDYRCSIAVETIVLSDQFRMIRGRSMTP